MQSSITETNINQRKYEPLLDKNLDRFTQLPLQFPELQKAYDEHEAKFWTAKEIDYNADLKDWNKLTNNEKYFIELILGFFAGADGIVLENLMVNFINEVTAPEARNFYAFQGMIENVHAQTYANLLDTFIKDPNRKNELFKAIETIPCIAKKADWAIKWMNSDTPFEQRLVAFACVEGIFFSGSFCAIFWLKDKGIMTKALGGSNELIARDEGLHTDFAVLMYNNLNNKLDSSIIREIISEAVYIEEEFICEALKCDLIGMNSELMRDYIKFTADRLATNLGISEIFKKDNPFDFMNRINMNSKTNFFEKRSNDYKHASISSNDWNNIVKNEDEDEDEW